MAEKESSIRTQELYTCSLVYLLYYSNIIEVFFENIIELVRTTSTKYVVVHVLHIVLTCDVRESSIFTENNRKSKIKYA